MNIDREKLIELLQEKTGMTDEEVENQLDELIKRIIQAGEKGKALEIKEFGMFFFSKDNTLQFDPADEFSTEINFKYTGMEPVEISPVTDETDNQTPEEKSETTASDEPDSPADTGEKRLNEDTDTSDIFGIGDAILDPAMDADEAEKAFSKMTEDPEKKKPEPSRKKEKKTKAPAKKPAPRSKKDPIGMIIYAILGVVIIAGIVIGIFFSMDSDSTTTSTTEQNQEMATTEEPAVTPETSENFVTEIQEQEAAPEVAEQDTEPVSEAEPEQEAETGYGLSGSMDTSLSPFYSIVVHSLQNEENARSVVSDLEDQNYRVSLNERTVQGQQVWRVSLGQFPSISEAQSAATTLPSPYNSENFIQRVQE